MKVRSQVLIPGSYARAAKIWEPRKLKQSPANTSDQREVQNR